MSRPARPRIITDRCLSCYFYAAEVGTCDYILITGTRRRCPAGDECNKYKERGASRSGLYLPGRGEPNKLEKKMRQLYDAGLDDPQIAKQLQVSTRTVYRWRHYNRLPSVNAQRKGEEPWPTI